jgi:Amt family ammonium transporter
MMGVTSHTYAGTFSNNVYLPEYVYVIFQMTFACITPALIVGAFAERVKFTPLMIFVVLWLTIAYYPMAHMVWYWAGLTSCTPTPMTPVPVSEGRAGLCRRHRGAHQRRYRGPGGLPRDRQARGLRQGSHPAALADHDHDRRLAAVGGLVRLQRRFQPGIERCGRCGLHQHLRCHRAAAVSWAVVEQIVHGKPSMLGAASGAVAGLVAITPASGFGAPMTSIVLGLVVSPICFFFVTTVKNKFKYDDTLDVFGVHCIGGIIGAIGTGIVANPRWAVRAGSITPVRGQGWRLGHDGPGHHPG